MHSNYTESPSKIEARKARILATLPQPWEPTLEECLAMEADAQAARIEKSNQVWADILAVIEGIKLQRAQA